MTTISAPPQNASLNDLRVYYQNLLDIPLDIGSGPQIRIGAAEWLRENGHINKEEADKLINHAKMHLSSLRDSEKPRE